MHFIYDRTSHKIYKLRAFNFFFNKLVEVL